MDLVFGSRMNVKPPLDRLLFGSIAISGTPTIAESFNGPNCIVNERFNQGHDCGDNHGAG